MDSAGRPNEGQVYLRYDKAKDTFDFKMEIEGKLIGKELTGLTMEQLGLMRTGMLSAQHKEAGEGMAQLFDWLIAEAKKDPEGRYVSASSAQVSAGQATI